ncbi:MAG: sulfite reductase, dissimilatory-type subunit alpha, partial [Eubacteriales bacterium]|nr:sulfite reductase, dissimilatory-type subunit alpha [Eubacteriales bacterium]
WGKFDIFKEVVDRCPSDCMTYEDGVLTVDDANCVRCMHCINTMPRAVRPGADTGLSILCGAKAPILEGAQMSTLVVPFMKAEAPYDNIKDAIDRIQEYWIEEGKNRERIGEMIQRIGLPKFLEACGLPVMPQHVWRPRENPYIFWKAEDVPGGFERDIDDYRKRHAR